MEHEVTEAEARLALRAIDRSRQQVVAEIDVPWWYWTGLAGGWVVLGVLAQFGPAWATIVGTVLFGAAHAAIAPHVLTGRHGSSRLSVHADLARRHLPLLAIGFLVAMVILTVALALLFNADGARHAALLANGVVAALVLTGGPTLMASVRRRAQRDLETA